MTGCGSPRIEGHGQMGRLFTLENGQDRVGEAIDSRAVYPLGGIDGTPDEGKMRTVGQRHTV